LGYSAQVRRWLTWAEPAGRLNAEQSLTWRGGLPAGLALADLPELMERRHFAAVAAYGFGAIRVRREGARVVCALPGGVPGLVFEWVGDELSERHAARWWRLGGRLMRPGEGARFGLGVELGEGHVRAWVRTERFPSVFLAPPLPRWARRLYESFHAHTSFAYLAALRRQLDR
jgi:hypothetical protein